MTTRQYLDSLGCEEVNVRDVIMYAGALGFPLIDSSGPDAAGQKMLEFEVNPASNIEDFSRVLLEWMYHFECYDEKFFVFVTEDTEEKERALRIIESCIRKRLPDQKHCTLVWSLTVEKERKTVYVNFNDHTSEKVIQWSDL